MKKESTKAKGGTPAPLTEKEKVAQQGQIIIKLMNRIDQMQELMQRRWADTIVDIGIITEEGERKGDIIIFMADGRQVNPRGLQLVKKEEKPEDESKIITTDGKEQS